jgi:hypothetical protein
VSLSETQARLIPETEEDTVRARLDELDLGVDRVEVKRDAIIVHEPQRSVELGAARPGSTPDRMKGIVSARHPWVQLALGRRLTA